MFEIFYFIAMGFLVFIGLIICVVTFKRKPMTEGEMINSHYDKEELKLKEQAVRKMNHLTDIN